MRYSVLLLIISLTLSEFLLAQSDFRPGYVITLNGDSIQGWLQYKGNKASAGICIFRLSEQGESIRYIPEDIRAYRFRDGKYYVSKKIKIGEVEKTLFLEYLIDGIVDIYYFRDDDNREIFLIDPGDGRLQVLDNSEREQIIDDVKYSSESRRYIGLLKFVFRDSEAVSREVDNMPLDHKSLINLAKDYHNEVCKDHQCIVFEKKLIKLQFRFGVLAGIDMNQILVSNTADGLNDFEGCKFKPSIYPVAGVFMRVNMPYQNEHLSLEYSGSVGKRSYKSTYMYSLQGIVTSFPLYMLNDVRFSQLILTNSINFQYDVPFGKWNTLLRAGLSIHYYPSTDYRLVYSIYEHPEYTGTITDDPFRKMDANLSLGAGISKKVLNGRMICLIYQFQYGGGMYYTFHNIKQELQVSIQFRR